MTIDPAMHASFAATADSLYAGLIRTQKADFRFDQEQGLGGRLVYAGELDGSGCALAVAANIAGAASLAASAEFGPQRQAIRNGTIDFLVNNLDEALRILKNEIRKGETVAVCVAQRPEEVERAMRELGVLPELLPPGAMDAPRFEAFLSQGARTVDPVAVEAGQVVLTWSVSVSPAHWLPKLDALANDCVLSFQGLEMGPALRWIRLAPRYLGRIVPGVRLLRCGREIAEDFLHRVRKLAASGRIGVSVEIGVGSCGQYEQHRFSPPADQAAKCPIDPALKSC
jgi:hypothetical protein